MKFKVGDKIKGLKNDYGITNENMHLARVEDTNGDSMRILVLEHLHPEYVGEIFSVRNSAYGFKLVKSKKSKHFKVLPNDFTGTLEVENGYIVEKEILDDVEKEYLENIIKPFKNKVDYIDKDISFFGEEFIGIGIKDEPTMFLPYFKKNTMYKGMETGREYSLEELGLDE